MVSYFQFVIGNMLLIDPVIFHTWMKERHLPLHLSLGKEPVVPKALLKKMKAEKEQQKRELLGMFTEAGVSPQQIAGLQLGIK